MFTKSRIVRLFLFPLAIVGTLGAGIAIAGPGGHGGPGGPLHHAFALERLDAMADELGLTDDQRTTIRAILEDARTQGEQLRADHEGLREEGVSLFTAAELDPVAIEAHRQKMLDAADAGSALASDTMLSVSEVLTPDQRQAVAKKIEQFHADGGMRDRMRERFHGERGERGERSR